MGTKDTSGDRYGQISEDFLSRIRRGESPSFEVYVRKYPEYSDAIRDDFPVISYIEQIKRQASQFLSSTFTDAQAGKFVGRRIGDFSILREIGRGGMGVVYEARQASLQRRVALKVLLPGSLVDEKNLRRFRREARAAAGLHHTNIVGVLGAGHDAGIHYIAMQYISGQSLSDVIRQDRETSDGPSDSAEVSSDQGVCQSGQDTDAGVDSTAGDVAPFQLPALGDPLRWTEIARIGSDIAGALAYAHSCGIVHRDVKPSNLLIDAVGTIWVSDFGLAKTLDCDDVTQTGDVLGTLRYQPPESLRGQYTESGDIFGLGLTIFELCTLRPARPGFQRHRLIRFVSSGESPDFSSLDRGIPRDLQTIIHKCTMANPSSRYRSALELKEDLDRYRKDLPIKARRISVVGRLARWCRRNPVISTTAIISTFFVVVTTTVALLAINNARVRALNSLNQARVARDDAEHARRAADEARGLAEERLKESHEHYRVARQSIKRYLYFMSMDGRLRAAGLAPLRQQLIAEAGRSYDALLEVNGDDETLQHERAQAYAQLGGILWEAALAESAAEMRQKAINTFGVLRRNDPANLRYIKSLATNYRILGDILYKMDRIRDSQAAFDNSLELMLEVAERNPDQKQEPISLSYVLTDVARHCARVGQLDSAERFYLAAIGLECPELVEHPMRARLHHRMASNCTNLAKLYVQSRQHDQAETLCQVAIQAFSSLHRFKPSNPDYTEYLALSQGTLGSVYLKTDRPNEAIRLIEDAIATLERLRQQRPHAFRHWGQMTHLQMALARARDQAGETSASISEAEAAVAQFRERTERYPDRSRYWRELGQAQLLLSTLYHRDSQLEKSHNTLTEGMQCFEVRINASTEKALHIMYFAEALCRLAELNLECGIRDDAAIQAATRALDQLEPLLSNPSDLRPVRDWMAFEAARLANVFGQLDRPDECKRLALVAKPAPTSDLHARTIQLFRREIVGGERFLVAAHEKHINLLKCAKEVLNEPT